ncbi:alpha/beta fold hydrolase [Oleomonas cavernae]|uniref:Alpha/beta fold hydrolase n=1 Tax=Oleomonas cavernae TaxID=2320859 RepID=A0A418WUG9_9PROT|nr:alpha/beta fold hydrolase [Oleomonas cavernae]RJF94924.1 alpha/beta fold hydrolase [Oleomonas cavernae]
MPTEAFDFTGSEGQALSGRLDLPEGPARSYAIFAHCFTCTKDSVAAVRIARALAARGIGVLRFDFTGLGHSEGIFSEGGFSGDMRDLLAAARALEASGRPPRLLIGHSLGGAAVLAAAGELPLVRAVATIGAPFDVGHVTGQFGDSLGEIVEKGEAKVNLGGRPFTVRRNFVDDLKNHDQKARIHDLHRALLVMHAPLDDIVGANNATAIFTAARHPKSFISLDDADHLLTRQRDADYAADVIAAWASRYVDQMAEAAPASEGIVVEATGNGRYQVQVSAGGNRFLADEPAKDGGLGSGPSPYDLLCAALGACTVMTLRMYADQKGWALPPLKVTVGHTKDKARTPPDLFSRGIAFEGALPDDMKARFLEIADRCPVHRTLERGAKVETIDNSKPAAPSIDDAADQHMLDMAEACADC